MYNTRAADIITNNGSVRGVITSKQTLDCDAVILATGGVSYPATGSTGDGYDMARRLVHEIIAPPGSLVPLIADKKTC